MPERFNSEFNYRYQVMGCTPWEKIKTLKSFLEGRVRAAAGEEIGRLSHDVLLSEMEHLKATDAPEHEQMKKRIEIIESESHRVILDEAFALNCKEIETLKKLLAEAYEMAEPTRIEGYSDDDMFEYNDAHEFTVRTMREMQSEIIANGRPLPSTVLHAMNNPVTLATAFQSGLLPIEAIPLAIHNPPVFAAEEMAALNTLREERLMADTEEVTIVDAPEEEVDEVSEEEAEEVDESSEGEE